MRATIIRTAVAAAAVTTAFGLLGAPLATADDATVAATTIGQQARLTEGGVVQGWTITGLKPSSDVIPYTAHGTLWEATATSEAIQGSVQPFVSNLNARAGDGANYRVLFGIATPQGINPGGLAEGEKSTGKVYFDVTGASPDKVVYNDGGEDLLTWNPAPAAPPASGGTGSWTPRSTGGSQSAAAPAAAPAATAPAPVTGSTGTPITEGTPTTTAPEAVSAGTPVTEGTPATPAPAAATPAPAPEAGSAGTPVSEGTPATPAPAAATPAPAAATPAPAGGSAGTPVGELVPVPTEVPHGAQYAPAS